MDTEFDITAEPQDWLAASQPRIPVDGLAPLSYPSRASLVPPRLVSAASMPAPSGTISLAAEQVHARVRSLTDSARSTGQLHSLRLWREGVRQALDALTRAALLLPDEAVCDSLTWTLENEVYTVTASYHLPSSVVLH